MGVHIILLDHFDLSKKRFCTIDELGLFSKKILPLNYNESEQTMTPSSRFEPSVQYLDIVIEVQNPEKAQTNVFMFLIDYLEIE